MLIPGGEARIGNESFPEAFPEEYRAQMAYAVSESPPFVVDLAPFFLSKYELTQGQWRWWTGTNPSVRGNDHTALHPVENVSWSQSRALLGWFGLRLPTEAQWEYAARAGSQEQWWCGDDPHCLIGRANLLDVEAKRLGENTVLPLVPAGFEDPFHGHCDVRELEPNPLGLHHMNGNVWEWCLDYATDYGGEMAVGDGELLTGSTANQRVLRGGSFLVSAIGARSAYRDTQASSHIARDAGLRPARRLVTSSD